jgi:hypothetical protein
MQSKSTLSARFHAHGPQFAIALLEPNPRQRPWRRSIQNGTVRSREKSVMARALEPILRRPVKYHALQMRAKAAICEISVGRRADQDAWVRRPRILKDLGFAYGNFA